MQALRPGCGLLHLHDVVDGLENGKVLLLQGHRVGFDLGNVEDVVDYGEQMLGRRLALVEPVDLLGIGGTAQHELGHAHDAAHRGAQFMAHVGEEDALGAVGGFGRVTTLRQFGGAGKYQLLEVVAVPDQLGFVLFARGDVAHDGHGGVIGAGHHAGFKYPVPAADM